MDLFALLLALPLCSGLLLTLVGERSWAPNLNIIASLSTFVTSVLLTIQVVSGGPRFLFGEQFFIDSMNVFFVSLTAFVGMTTAIFSQPYMKNEVSHGRLTTPRIRLYKSMYQLFMFTMLVALTTNNLGILWVAMEAATLTTVLPVSRPMVAGFDWSRPADRREFLRVRIGVDGRLERYANQSSAVLTSCVWADGLVDNPAQKAIKVGDNVRYYAFGAMP